MATKRSGGAKTARTETVTVRLDPELRYLAEIAARCQRRTLSSYVEWAIIKSLDQVILSDDPDDHRSISERAASLWDVDEADRFANLALNAPHLLTYDEQVMWKVIREYGYFWNGYWLPGDDANEEFSWEVKPHKLRYDRLREQWEVLKQIANGDKTVDDLPPFKKERSIF